MWNLSRSGIKPLSPTVAGRHLPIIPPRKFRYCFWLSQKHLYWVRHQKKKLGRSWIQIPFKTLLFFRLPQIIWDGDNMQSWRKPRSLTPSVNQLVNLIDQPVCLTLLGDSTSRPFLILNSLKGERHWQHPSYLITETLGRNSALFSFTPLSEIKCWDHLVEWQHPKSKRYLWESCVLPLSPDQQIPNPSPKDMCEP